MKQVLITMFVLLTLAMSVDAASQKHRHSSKSMTELVDSTSKDGVEVYSDTTQATPMSNTTVNDDDFPFDDEDDFTRSTHSHVSRIFATMNGKDVVGMLFVLGVLFIIFVLSPVLIIVALFYFINKNRKEKIRLAQMAMQQGQPIPEQLLEDRTGTVNDDYQKGLRQCFVGVGLMVFLGYAAGEIGFGIGALVFCIGLGKVIASWTTRKRE